MKSSIAVCRRRLRLAVPAAALLLAACADDGIDRGLEELLERPETAVDYEVRLIGVPTEEMEELAEESLNLFRYQDDGAPSPAFLYARAESDIETMQRILKSRGYYLGEIEVEVRVEGDPPPEGMEEGWPEIPPAEAIAIMVVDPGPPFTLTRHDIEVEHRGPIPPPKPDAAALGSPVGEQALAAEIASAESGAVEILRESGYPYAEYQRRRGLADPEAATLEVTSFLTSGPSAVFGDVNFLGTGEVEESYLRTYVTWEPGETFDDEKLRDFQRALLDTNLFLTVTAEPPESPPEGEEEPVVLTITAEAEPRPPRTIAGSLRYDTDRGPSARVSFEHRNLFRRNETFRAEAEGAIDEQRIAFLWRQPQFRQPGQDLVADLELRRTREDAFDAETVTAFVGLERELSDKWEIGFGPLVEASRIRDEGVTSEAFLGGVRFYADFDDTEDPLDPKRGERLRVEVTPLAGLVANDATGLLIVDAEATAYRPLDEDERYILAGRVRAGAIFSGTLEDVPPTRRLYAGGGGSVRGYAQDFVGPLDANNDPIGGRSALIGGLELRARLYGDFGGVVFVEGGTVSPDLLPNLEAGLQFGAGIGLRYDSLAGPIRFDIGVPLNRRDADDAFQFYFSIGQAF